MRLTILNAGIQILFIFADDNHIHIGVLGSDKGVVGNAGTDICIESKCCARGDIEALVTTTLWCRNWGLEEYSGTTQRLPGAGFDTRANAAQVDLFADLNLLDVNARARFLDDVQGSCHNFWAYAIPVSNCNWCVLCHDNCSYC